MKKIKGKKQNGKKTKAKKKEPMKPDFFLKTFLWGKEKEASAWAKQQLEQPVPAPKKTTTVEEARLLARRLNLNYGRSLEAIKEAEAFLLWAGRYENEFGRKAREVLGRMMNHRYGLPVTNPFSLDQSVEPLPKWLKQENF